MKKIALITLVLVLLATTAMPALAGNGNPNGQGQGSSTGPADPGDNENQENEKNTVKEKNRAPGLQKEKNQLKEKNFNSEEKFKNQAQTKWMYAPFYLQGNITAIDTVAGTITVNLFHANAKVREFLYQDLVIKVTESTVIFQLTQGGDGDGGEADDASDSLADDGDSNRVPITFEQLVVGNKVAIHGRLVDPDYTARLITMYVVAP